MKFSLNKIWEPRKIQVISIELANDGERYHYVNLKKSKGEVIVKDNFSEKNIEELIKNVSKSTPVILHFYGKGVLNRVVPPDPDFLDKLLVNADKKEFYFSHEDINNQRYASFSRKDKIDELISRFDSIKDNIIDFSIGPYNAISENLPVKPTATPLGKIKKDNRVYSFVKDETPTKNFFLNQNFGKGLFAAVTGYLFLNNAPIFSFLNEKEQKSIQSNFTDKIQFQQLGIFTLSFFLIALISNYFYQGHINKKNHAIEQEIMIYGDNLNKIDLIDQEILRKKQLITSSGIIGGTRFSHYLDQIGSSLPSEVSLEEIEIYPIEKKLKQKEKPVFKDNSILISGNTQQSSIIDDWISKLNSLDWVKSVAIISFIKNDDNKYSYFQIKITEG